MKFTYLCIDLFSVLIPFVFSFHPKVKFSGHFKTFFAANGIVAILFLGWDVFFTHKGVWGFNPVYVSGIYLAGLPLEELLFFICIPFACVFTYHLIGRYFNIRWKQQKENIFVISLSVILLVTGLYFHSLAYTSVTFISTALILLILRFVFRVSWMGKLFTVYPVLLIPFFLVNGILTGSGLKEPVVWYNNDENLGIRLLTIPVEDMVYGFELILLNIFLFEYFKAKTNEAVVA